MVQLDNFTTLQKQQYIIATTSIGLVLSTTSMVARTFARIRTIHGIRQEDWYMGAGLLLSYGTAGCLLYGVPVQGVPLPQLSPKERKEFLLMIWIIQKIQPPTLFAIKISIIAFQAHIFQSQTFRRISWAVAIFTGLWMVANILGTTFQCSPPSYFYDKSGGPPAGTCIHDPVHRMGIPNAVLSSVGDIIIFAMPIPPLLKLSLPRRTKIGLIGVFSLGLFVLIASFFRWIALIGADPKVFNSAQIQVGVWTYLEMSVAITCGNLPFLAPLLGCVGPRRRGGGGAGAGAAAVASSADKQRLPSHYLVSGGSSTSGGGGSLLKYFPRRMGGRKSLFKNSNNNHNNNNNNNNDNNNLDESFGETIFTNSTTTTTKRSGTPPATVLDNKPLPPVPRPASAQLGGGRGREGKARRVSSIMSSSGGGGGNSRGQDGFTRLWDSPTPDIPEGENSGGDDDDDDDDQEQYRHHANDEFEMRPYVKERNVERVDDDDDDLERGYASGGRSNHFQGWER